MTRGSNDSTITLDEGRFDFRRNSAMTYRGYPLCPEFERESGLTTGKNQSQSAGIPGIDRMASAPL